MGQPAEHESTGDRVLVAVSAHPLSERLVQTAARLAAERGGQMHTIYIQTPDRQRFQPERSEQVSRSLQLAESLGARVATIQGQSIARAVIDYARENDITTIVVGKPIRPRWREILDGSVTDEIIRLSGNIDVYVVPDPSGPLDRWLPMSMRPHRPGWRYLASLLLVAAASVISIPVHYYINPTNLVMLYLAVVVVAAVLLGRGPSILASIASVLAFDVFFVEPRFSFTVSDTQYILTFFGLLAVGLIISNLASLLRDQVEAARRQAAQTAALAALGQDLAVAGSQEAILQAVIERTRETLGRDTVILLEGNSPFGQRRLTIQAASPGFQLTPQEMEAAQYALENGRDTGRGTQIQPELKVRFVPLRTGQGVLGVLGVLRNKPEMYFTPDQRQLLDSYASLAALAIERAHLAEEAGQAQILSASEKLQSALLNSISHDLRTPLSTVTGVLSTLREDETPSAGQSQLDPATRADLLETAWEEADRLNRFFGNLLEMSRIQAGALRISLEPYDVSDLVGAALAQMGTRLEGRPVKVEIPADMPMIQVDFVLLQLVLSNLLDNALKYTPAGSPLEIWAEHGNGQAVLSIADRGAGIAESEQERIFEKFYRGPGAAQSKGNGLGLSICKGIVEAHHGKIGVRNRPGGGSVFYIVLPLVQSGENGSHAD